MKNYTIFIALVLMTNLSISNLFATALPLEDITIGNTTESIFVNWNNLNQQTIHVKIVTANQEVVIDETVKNQTELMKQYNVSTLENGSYNLVITKKNSRITQPFSIENGQLKLSENDKKVKYLPVFTQKNNQFDVNVFLGYVGTITVNVFDEDQHTVFTQAYTDVSFLHKRFSLNNTAEGVYKIAVTAGDETFYYTFIK